MAHIREWLQTVTDGASLRSVADRVGEYNVTFTRRIDAGDAQTITAVARAYNVNPIPGLIAADILSEDDLDAYVHEVGIDAYTDLELAEKVVKRIQERQDSPLATVTEFPTALSESNEQGYPENVDVAGGEYREVIYASHHSYNPDTGEYEETIPEDAVADSSPDEDTTLEDFEP